MEQEKEIVKQLQKKIKEDLNFAEELSDEQLKELIGKYLLEKEKKYSYSLQQRKQIGKEIFDSFRKLDILQDLIDDDEITEIMVNGPEDIFIEKSGAIYKTNLKFESKEKLLQIINQIVSECNRSVNESTPIVDARLKKGARVNVVLYPIALNGPILTIRKFPKNPITMKKLIELEAVSEEAVEFLRKAVAAKYNIIISGGTGSGKTTFLNALSQYIPRDERIITIEDSAELQILGVNNLIRMETRNANLEGGKQITIRDLIKASLRMRPDRRIIKIRIASTKTGYSYYNTKERVSPSQVQDVITFFAISFLSTDVNVSKFCIKLLICSARCLADLVERFCWLIKMVAAEYSFFNVCNSKS